MTVWNHSGRKYITEKLHVATRKLDNPTSTGIFCLSRKGARTGSGAINISTVRKRSMKRMAIANEMYTEGDDHYKHVNEGAKEVVCSSNVLVGPR